MWSAPRQGRQRQSEPLVFGGDNIILLPVFVSSDLFLALLHLHMENCNVDGWFWVGRSFQNTIKQLNLIVPKTDFLKGQSPRQNTKRWLTDLSYASKVLIQYCCTVKMFWLMLFFIRNRILLNVKLMDSKWIENPCKRTKVIRSPLFVAAQLIKPCCVVSKLWR